MATSVAELKRLRDDMRRVLKLLDEYIATDEGEQQRARELAEPAPRLNRIP